MIVKNHFHFYYVLAVDDYNDDDYDNDNGDHRIVFVKQI